MCSLFALGGFCNENMIMDMNLKLFAHHMFSALSLATWSGLRRGAWILAHEFGRVQCSLTGYVVCF
jgi:hypothetical protein